MALPKPRLLSGLVAAFLGLASGAQATQLLPNPGFTGTSGADGLKPEYVAETSFSVPTSGNTGACNPGSAALAQAPAYSYGTEEGGAYIDVSFTNNTSCTMGYTLRMLSAAPPSGGNIPVQPGARYTLSGAIKIITYDGTSGGALALELSSANAYLGGEGVDYSPYVKNVYQPLSSTYQVTGTGPTLPVSVGPHVGIWNIKAGGAVRFRLKSPSLTDMAAPTGITLKGLLNRQVIAKPGKPVKLSVDFDLVASANYALGKSMLQLIDANNTIAHSVVPTDRTLRPTFGDGGGWGSDIDGWSFTVPSTLAPGVYKIRYTIKNLGTIVAGPGVTSLGSNQYDLGQLVVDSQAGIYIGQHFHRYPSDTDYPGPLGVTFNFVRTLNSNLNVSSIADSIAGTSIVNTPKWWTGKDGQVNTTALSGWADRHAPAGATANTRFALITFNGVPNWASSRKNETYVDSSGQPATWMQDGEASPPASLVEYSKMVVATINAIGKNRVLGVECWNEPDDRLISFSPAATLTDLADICKTIHEAARSVDANILTFCPQPMDVRYLPTLLAAKTSESPPQPIHKYCDVIGAHNYDAAGTEATGRNYTKKRLIDFVGTIRQAASGAGISKAIAITELGFPDGGSQAAAKWKNHKFSSRTWQGRGEVVYQTLAQAAELGVVFPALYSYDTGATPSSDQRDTDFPKGYLGNQTGVGTGQDANGNPVNNLHVVQFDADVNGVISNATTDLAQATSVGLKPVSLGIYMLPSTTSIAMAGASSRPLNFNIAVVNRGHLPAKAVTVSTEPGPTTYSPSWGANNNGTNMAVINSITGPSGSNCSPTGLKWICSGFDIAPGAAVTLQVQGQVVPTSGQQTSMGFGYRFHFAQKADASFAGQLGALPAVSTPVITIQKN